MSILSEMLKGKPLSEVKTFSKETLLDEIGMEVTSPRIKCALLSLETFRKSVE
jgi:NifU-like protein involved in Fe-S cluster formation